MTDQNNLARDYSAEIQDDDPLAELARIVSGQPVKPAASFKPKSFAEIARAKTGELQAMAERQAAELRQKAVAQRQPDIEEALMRELGFSMGEEPEPRRQEVAPVVQAAPVEEYLPPHFEPEAYEEPEAYVEPEPEAPAPQLSLEEQLLAELMADDAAPADPYADIWTERRDATGVQPADAPFADVHEQAYEEFRRDAADWREIDPQDDVAAGDGEEPQAYAEHEAHAEQQAYEVDRGYNDPQAVTEPQAYEDSPLALEDYLAASLDENDAAQTDLESVDANSVADEDFVQQFQESFEQEFGNRFADGHAEAANHAAADAVAGADGDRGYSYGGAPARAFGLAAGRGEPAPEEMADDDFMKELDAAFEPDEPDPYAVDFTELAMAADLARSEGGQPSQPAVEEDELFRELAQGSLAAQGRGSAAAAGESPLYTAKAPVFAAAPEMHSAPAGQEAGFDDFDFGDALEAEVRQAVAAGSAGANPAKAAAPSPRLVEEQFAAAFAEELDMGDGLEPDAYGAPAGAAAGGWRPDETLDSNRNFVELAAPRAASAAAAPSGRNQYAAAQAAYDDALPYGDESYPEDQDPGFEPSFDAAAGPAGRGGRARRGFVLAASALGLALLLGGGALAYGYFSGSVTTLASGEAAPVIKADAGPVKIKPEDPGGAEVQNQDKAVYDRVAGRGDAAPEQETLISTSEDPVDVAALAAEEAPLPQDDLPVALPVETPGETASLDPAAEAPAADAKAEERLTPGAAPVQPEAQAQAALAPRRVRTVVVTPDGKIIARPDPEPAAATPVETAFAPPVAQARPDAVAAIAPEAPQAVTEDARQQSAPAAPEPKPVAEAAPEQRQPVEVAKAESKPAAAVPSAAPWAVQLASQRSAEDAQATFQNLRRKFPDILANRALAVQRADVEGKGTFFRVRLPAQTKAEAAEICEQLKAAGGSCFVTR